MSSTSRSSPQRPRDWLSDIHFQYLPYNWVVGSPTVCCLFANVFFCVAAFSCSSFVARAKESAVSHYGYWGVRQEGQCKKSPIVDASLILGRAFGLIGLIVGLAYLAFWISLWTIRVPRNLLHLVSTTLSTTMVIMTMTLHFMGLSFEQCDSPDDGGLTCRVTGLGKLTIASTIFWILSGASVLLLADQPEESTASLESAPPSGETAHLARLTISTADVPTRAPPRSPVVASPPPVPEMLFSANAQPTPTTFLSPISPPVRPHGPSQPAARPVAASAPMPPRVIDEVNYQPDGSKAVTTTKSYVQPDGTTVVERTTEFSDRPSSGHINEDDDDDPLDAFKPNPQSQPPRPEFDEEHGKD